MCDYPEVITINDIEYEINTGYEYAIACFNCINDVDLSDYERTYGVIGILYKIMAYTPYSPSTPNKTGGGTLFALASTAASTVAIASAVDVSTKFGCLINIYFGRRSATAAGAGVNILVEGSTFASGDDNWGTLAQLTTGFAACEAEAVSGTVNAGATVITVAATANLTAQDFIFIDNSTIANSEWRRIKSIVSNTSVTVIDALTNAQTGSTLYDSAESYAVSLDLSRMMRLRIVFDGSLFTQAFAAKATVSYLDSIV